MRFMRPSFAAYVLAAALFAFACGPAARADVEGHFDRTLHVSGSVDLDVETGSGSISVRPGNPGSVEVHGTIHSGRDDSEAQSRVHALESNPPIEQSGNTIHLGHVPDRELTRNISISYEIVVPADTKIRSQSGSGSQHLEGISGPADLSTGSGSLKVANIGNDVHARTGSGGVDINSVRGSVHTSTGSGSIEALAVAGNVSASTGSGSIKVEQTAPGDVEVESGSGEIQLKGIKGGATASTGSGSITAEGEPSGPWRLRSSSGSLTVRLPENAAFDVQAATTSGHIETSHPITVVGSVSPRELHGKVRGGGPLLELSTTSGSIRIE